MPIVFSGFADGLLHPVLGLDHLLAMISIGIVSTTISRSAIWTAPALFVLAMAVGGVLGLNHTTIPFREGLIAASLVTLGVAIASTNATESKKSFVPAWLIFLFVTTFGIAHGNAHGVEIPTTADPIIFTIGFLLGTSALHIAGVGIGLLAIAKSTFSSILRVSGMFTAALGIGVLTRF